MNTKYKKLDLTKKSQLTEVYKYIQTNGSITDREAHDHIGAERLGAIIFDLRHIYGVPIKTVNINVTDRFGTNKNVGKYMFDTENTSVLSEEEDMKQALNLWFNCTI